MKPRKAVCMLLTMMVLLSMAVFVSGCASPDASPAEEARVGSEADAVGEKIAWDCHPALMWDDRTYLFTDTKLREADLDGEVLGEVSSVVDLSVMPSKNGEANMPIEGAAVMRYGEDLAVHVDTDWMEDTWILFRRNK